jgi:hypothetical protein
MIQDAEGYDLSVHEVGTADAAAGGAVMLRLKTS